MERVGMVGVGAMGSALLERLKLAGVQPIVYDIDGAALEKAGASGAEIADSVAAVARASAVVDVVVRSDEEVLQCALGPESIVENISPGSLVILHSTILPETTRRVAAEAAARNVHVIDACMLGVPRAVRN